jgi:ATP-dependent DNA helicase RecG
VLECGYKAGGDDQEMAIAENSHTEFKRDFVDDIKKTIIAFANSDGGTLFVGIDDDGSVVGVSNPDDTLLRITNSIRDSIKPDLTLFVDCNIEKIKNKMVVKVEVQKGTASPYYLTGKGIRPEGVYIRHGASTVPATEAAIIKMIKETDGENYEDVRSINQELTFVEASKEFEARNIPFEANQFRSLRLTTADGVFTNLGLLLSDQCVQSIKLAVFEGSDKSMFRDRREFTGSLLKQMNDIYDFIDLYNGMQTEILGLHRIDKRDYPIDAIREALLNALVHRDYSFSGSTLISIFRDRIEFLSIGGLVRGISFEDIMLGISIARNEKLANIFYRLTLIEAYGTGVPKILRAYDKARVKPVIEATDNAFKITLPNMNFEGKEAAYSENEKRILELLNNSYCITRKDIENLLGISQTAAGRLLKKLVQSGTLSVSESGKNTKYKAVK